MATFTSNDCRVLKCDSGSAPKQSVHSFTLRTYHTVLYYTPDEMKELRGSPAFEDALKQFKYIARQYAYFYKKFQVMILRDYFTFDEYRWAVSTVMTRQNQVSATSCDPPPPPMAVHPNPRITFFKVLLRFSGTARLLRQNRSLIHFDSCNWKLLLRYFWPQFCKRTAVETVSAQTAELVITGFESWPKI